MTPELEKFVQRLVASGRYRSASEVFREGLRLLERAEHRRLLEKWLAEGLTTDEQTMLPAGVLANARADLQARIKEGLDEASRGEFIDGEAFFAQWRTRLDAAAASELEPMVVKRRP